LIQGNGDDYPDAARKHLEDANVLLSGQRFDGVAYLSGYVVECAMKTLIQVETGSAPRSHDLARLDRTLGTLAVRVGAQTARLYTRAMPLLRNPTVLKWDPGMRYRRPVTVQADADASLQAASDVYRVIIGGLVLDGVL
jgi:HEPN domain-containing protein